MAPVRARDSLPPSYFEALYTEHADPWRFASSPYERAKYAATLEALPRQHYAHALEVGCSIGVLTGQLAAHCASLLAVDVVDAALHEAASRCAHLDGVTIRRLHVPDETPAGRFDLIVLSEVVYYWNAEDIARVADLIQRILLPDGDLVLVHWLGETDYPLSGDDAATALLAAVAPFTAPLLARRTGQYRLDLVRRRPAHDQP